MVRADWARVLASACFPASACVQRQARSHQGDERAKQAARNNLYRRVAQRIAQRARVPYGVLRWKFVDDLVQHLCRPRKKQRPA